MKTSFFIILFLNFGLYILSAQDLPKITPPSPEAASFAKFSETPVSLYTGLPNINVPFSSINIDGLEIPVGISYHARGIKVEEIASRVGIGWTLEAGGAITRQTQGSADELPYYGYLNLDTYSNIFTNSNYRALATSNITNNPDYDLLPDMFHIQAPGLSGKFLINQITGLPLLKSFNDMKIHPVMEGDLIGGFIITNDEGFKYYFGKSQDNLRFARDLDLITHAYSYSSANGLNINSSSDIFPVYTSWKLMDIVSPQGKSVTFSYNFEEPIFHRRSYDKLDRNINLAVSYFSRVKSTQYQLAEINAENTKVEFLSSTAARLDLQDAFQLAKVNIYRTGVLKKSFDLNYNYSTCIDDTNQLAWLETDATAKKRLRLISVTEKGSNGSSLPSYEFQYNSQPLPNRFSNSQDYWGYYNGANNGRYLTFFNYGTFNINRSVDTIASQRGMLEKIIYPTGGSTKFIYEHNKARPTGTIADLYFPNPNPISTQNKSVGLSQIEHLFHYNGTVYSKPFTIGTGVTGNVSSNVSFTTSLGCSSTEYTSGCKFRVFVRKGKIFSYELFIGQKNFNLSPGDYDLVVVPQEIHDPYNMADAFMVSLNWVEQTQADSNQVIYTSGKRIKRIETYDGNNELKNFREYAYVNSQQQSTGALLGLPSFYSIKTTNGPSGSVILEPNGSVPGSPLSTAQGNTIGYGLVTEYYGDKINNVGKTEHSFSLTQDNGNYMSYPYHIPNDNEWLRGHSLGIKYYRKNQNNSYTLIKTIENEYKYADVVLQSSAISEGIMFMDEAPHNKLLSSNLNDPVDLFNISPTRFKFPLYIAYLSDPQNAFSQIMYKAYYITGGTGNIVSTVETSYDGPTPLVNTTLYGYNYSKHYKTSSITSFTSDESPLIKKIIYPTDLLTRTTPEDMLILRNRIVPIEIYEYKDINKDNIGQLTEQLSVLRNTYAVNIPGFPSGKVGLSLVSKGKKTAELEPLIQYHRYDIKGNPLEVSQINGPTTVYLWGYSKQFPIAKIENATYAEVAAALNISVTALDNYSENQLTEINLLRSNLNLAKAMITTYTYVPLIGVTSVTDPKDDKITYHYDVFNRLQYVKDKEGNLLSENKYNYAN